MTNRLKFARFEKGVNQFYVAKAIGIGRDRFLRIELEYTEPTRKEVLALARYFRKPVGDLFPDYQDEEAAAS